MILAVPPSVSQIQTADYAAVAPLAKVLEQQLLAMHTAKVYGTAPGFQITVVADRQVGVIGELLNKPGSLTEGDLKTPPFPLPATIMPGASYQLQEPGHCSSGVNIGVVLFAAIHCKDVFGTPHYARFCYDNSTLIAEALGNPDPKK